MHLKVLMFMVWDSYCCYMLHTTQQKAQHILHQLKEQTFLKLQEPHITKLNSTHNDHKDS